MALLLRAKKWVSNIGKITQEAPQTYRKGRLEMEKKLLLCTTSTTSLEIFRSLQKVPFGRVTLATSSSCFLQTISIPVSKDYLVD